MTPGTIRVLSAEKPKIDLVERTVPTRVRIPHDQSYPLTNGATSRAELSVRETRIKVSAEHCGSAEVRTRVTQERSSVMTRANVMVVLVAVTCAGAAVWGQQAASTAETSTAALQQARRYALLVRSGQFDVAATSVTLLEGALQTDPEDVALLNALTTAYQHQALAAGQPGGDAQEARVAALRAFAVSERALQIDPDNPEALAAHGGMLFLASPRPERVQAGIAEVFRAVALAPAAVQPRLYRKAIGLAQPADRRDTAALIDDLTFLSRVGAGSRSGAMEHVFLGDVYAEIGKTDEARREYLAATKRPASEVRDLVQSRLAALDEGIVPSSEIMKLRGELGNCLMCHAR